MSWLTPPTSDPGLQLLATESTVSQLDGLVSQLATENTASQLATESTASQLATAAGLAQFDQAFRSLTGELAVRMAEMADAIGAFMPDTAGRMRVNAEVLSNLSNVSSVTTVTTVSTVSAVSSVAAVNNVASIGAIAANQHMYALTLMSEASLRQNIVIP